MKRYLSSISTKTFLLFSTLVLLLSGGLPAFASAAQLTQAGVRLGEAGGAMLPLRVGFAGQPLHQFRILGQPEKGTNVG